MMTAHAPGHVTCRQGVKMTACLEFPRPYCLFTVTLLWSCGNNYGSFVGENFIQERFWLKILKSLVGPHFSTVWGFSRDIILTLSFRSQKGLTLAWGRVVRAIARENLPGGLTCRSVNKKYIILQKFSLYFTHLQKSPQSTDLHEILHRGSSRGRNHLFQNLCRSVQGFRNCKGSNFAFLHWLSRSPLTQVCATVRL